MNHILNGPVTRVALCSGLALVLLPLVTGSASMSIEIVVFATAVLGANLLLGFTGLMSFAQGAFFGVGAYVAGLLRVEVDAGMLAVIVASGLAGAVASAVVGWISIRRQGIYFVMLTLAFAQLFYFLAYAFPGITGGENGLQGVSRPSLALGPFEIAPVTSNTGYYIFAASLFLILSMAVARVIHSPFGQVLLAIRENERRASATGYDVRVFKIIAFAIAGALAGIAGALQAMFVGLASISNVEILMSQEILMMSIIGGANSLAGALVGSGFVVAVSSVLSTWWPRWLLLLGLILMVVVLYFPGGLVGAARSLVARLKSGRPAPSSKGGLR